jgi:hypothetical protein
MFDGHLRSGFWSSIQNSELCRPTTRRIVCTCLGIFQTKYLDSFGKLSDVMAELNIDNGGLDAKQFAYMIYKRAKMLLPERLVLRGGVGMMGHVRSTGVGPFIIKRVSETVCQFISNTL